MVTTFACAATTLLGVAAVIFASAFALATLTALVVGWRLATLAGGDFPDVPDVDDLDGRIG